MDRIPRPRCRRSTPALGVASDAIGGIASARNRPARSADRCPAADALQPRDAQPELFRAGRDRNRPANRHDVRHCHGRWCANANAARWSNCSLVRLSRCGSHARQAGSVFVHRNGDGGGSFRDHAVCVFASRSPAMSSRCCFQRWFMSLRLLSLGLLVGTKAENQMQALQMSMVFMLPSVFFSGFHFPARNDAVDFLRARLASSRRLISSR